MTSPWSSCFLEQKRTISVTRAFCYLASGSPERRAWRGMGRKVNFKTITPGTLTFSFCPDLFPFRLPRANNLTAVVPFSFISSIYFLYNKSLLTDRSPLRRLRTEFPPSHVLIRLVARHQACPI